MAFFKDRVSTRLSACASSSEARPSIVRREIASELVAASTFIGPVDAFDKRSTPDQIEKEYDKMSAACRTNSVVLSSPSGGRLAQTPRPSESSTRSLNYRDSPVLYPTLHRMNLDFAQLILSDQP